MHIRTYVKNINIHYENYILINIDFLLDNLTFISYLLYSTSYFVHLLFKLILHFKVILTMLLMYIMWPISQSHFHVSCLCSLK